MKKLIEIITGRIEIVVLGIVLIAGVILLTGNPPKRPEYDTWSVEIMVTEKEIAEIRGEEIYLIHAKDRDGQQSVFEITAEAIGDHFTEDEVYREIKTGKYYRLRVSDPEVYDSYYPSISGAAKLIEGFSEPPEQ